MFGWAAAVAAIIGSMEAERAQRARRSSQLKKDDGEKTAKQPTNTYSSTYEPDFTPPVFSTTYIVDPSPTFEPSSSSSGLIGGGSSFYGGGASGDY